MRLRPALVFGRQLRQVMLHGLRGPAEFSGGQGLHLLHRVPGLVYPGKTCVGATDVGHHPRLVVGRDVCVGSGHRG